MTAIKFIDTNAATNGSGTHASPWNAMPADYAYSENTIYAIKAGSVIPSGVMANNPGVKFCAYGSGPKPVWLNGSRDMCLDLTTGTGNSVENISFVGECQKLLKNGSSVSISTDTGHLIKGCTFKNTLHDNNDNNGLHLYGANNKVFFNIFDDIATDAIWMSGNNVEVAYNRISRVARDGRYAGDCIQLFSGDAPHVHHNYLDHLSNTGKQCIILAGGTPSTSLFEYNYCLMSDDETYNTNVLFSNASTATFKHNIIIGGVTGIWSLSNTVIESNLILNDSPTGQGALIGTAKTHSVLNNTFVSPKRTGRRGLKHSDATAVTSGTYKNNIFVGFQYIALNMITQTNVTEDYNLFYDNVQNREGSLGSNSLILDPLFSLDRNNIIQRYIPQSTLALQLGTTGASTDLVGSDFVSAIGAIQPDNFCFDDELLPVYWSINGQNIL